MHPMLWPSSKPERSLALSEVHRYLVGQPSHSSPVLYLSSRAAKIGRRWTMELFTLIFLVGAVNPMKSSLRFILISHFLESSNRRLRSSAWPWTYIWWSCHCWSWYRRNIFCCSRFCLGVFPQGGSGAYHGSFPDHGTLLMR